MFTQSAWLMWDVYMCEAQRGSGAAKLRITVLDAKHSLIAVMCVKVLSAASIAAIFEAFKFFQIEV